jgi:hypothetical protein
MDIHCFKGIIPTGLVLSNGQSSLSWPLTFSFLDVLSESRKVFLALWSREEQNGYNKNIEEQKGIDSGIREKRRRRLSPYPGQSHRLDLNIPSP